jgi:hypothetical protein
VSPQLPSQKPQFIPQKPPIQNSKEFKIYQQRRVKISSLKKRRKRERKEKEKPTLHFELQIMEFK